MSVIDDITLFRNNFYKKYHEVLVPAIKGYETERKWKLAWAIFSSVSLILLGSALLWFEFHTVSKPDGRLEIMLIILGFSMYSIIKKDFEGKIKKKIMGTVASCFGDIRWSSYYDNSKVFVDAGVVPAFTSFEFDDVFRGSYKGVSIDVVEPEYIRGSGKHRTVVFNGVVIMMSMNKNFTSHTVVMEDTIMHTKPLPYLRHTELEDVEFEKKYDVFTDDEVDARYILTPVFMEKLKNIKLAFHCSKIRCAFYKDKLVIAMPTSKDLFSICSLVKPVTDTKQFMELADQFISILKLVDHFKLDKKAVL